MACCCGCCGYGPEDQFKALLAPSTVTCLGASTDQCCLSWDGVCWSCSIAISCFDHGSLAWDLLTIVICCDAASKTFCGHIVLTGPASVFPGTPFVGCEQCTPCDPFHLTLTCSSLEARVGCCVASEIIIEIIPTCVDTGT